MDRETRTIVAQLALSLVKSKAPRRALAGLVAVQAVVLAFVVVLPAALVSSSVSALKQIAIQQACASSSGASGTIALSAATGNELRVNAATWNVLKTNSVSQIMTGLQAIIAAGADTIGLQELEASRRPEVIGEMRALGWSVSGTNLATPIFYRATAFEKVTEGRVKVFGVVKIEGGGAAGTSIGPKSIQWVQLRDRTTGAVFVHANEHLVPSIETRGRPDPDGPRRVGYAEQQLRATAALIDQLGQGGQLPILVSADWNVDVRQDERVQYAGFPYAYLGAKGLRSNWNGVEEIKVQTHTNRTIDAIFSTVATAIPAGQRVLGNYGSDHRAVLVKYTNRRDQVSSNSGAGTTTTDTTTTDTTATATDTQVPASLTVPSASGSTMQLSSDQLQNASIIIAAGQAANVPVFGQVVAIAAALQESGLKNLDYGDRDSLGLFQQRPSSGWGTPAQVMDPQLSAQAFYGVAQHTKNRGLLAIPNWQTLTVAEAAQAVQVSAFPDAYAKWEATARGVVQQLGDGSSLPTTALLCGSGTDTELGTCPATGSPAEQGLTRDALLILRCTKAHFPVLTEFGGVREDSLPDHPSGRAVDAMIPDYTSAAGVALGNQVAEWIKANHTALGVQYVIWNEKIWSVERDSEGWRAYSPQGAATDSSLHRNHVHTTVYGNAGTGFQGATAGTGSAVADLAPGQWTMALPPGTYSVGCGFVGCYPGHTGQDFPCPVGTPVRSTNAGVVTSVRDLTPNSYGKFIVIKDAANPSLEVYYAHLSDQQVVVGQQVVAGQVIGLSGNTGNTSGPHLHYEIRIDGRSVNPMPVLAQMGVHP